MKKIFSLMAAALVSLTMVAASVTDLKPINRNWSFIADNITNTGTASPKANTLYEGDFIFMPTANSVSTAKGQNTINGVKCNNSLRLKLAQDRLAFAVYDECTITFYTESHAERGILVSTMDNNTDEAKALAKQPASTPVWKTTLPAAGTYYLTSYGKDFYFAGFTVEFEGGGEPVTEYYVSYVNTTGVVIGVDTIAVGGTLDAFKYGESDVTVPEGKVFRGWFTSDAVGATKIKLGATVENDMRIYAQATGVEVAEGGRFYSYDLSSASFYPEDHELIDVESDKVILHLNDQKTIIVYVSDGKETFAQDEGSKQVETPKAGLQKVTLYFVKEFMGVDPSGYKIVPAGDAASLMLTLRTMEDNDKIFLPDGVYDLGESVLNPLNKKNVSIIGQSMKGTIIKNAPDSRTESINNTATLYVTGENAYLQDLTLQNALDYYKNNNGRAVALWAKSKKTICKNVRLLSYQDTYYSNCIGGVHYMEDCEIHGTVDFICGDGSVYFKNNLLYCEARSSNSDVITASNADANDKGYVFESCRIQSKNTSFTFGRAWNNAPKAVFLNTVLDKTAGDVNLASSRWTSECMNALPTLFGEFNTKDAEGKVVSPETNEVTFTLKETSKKMNTILAADAAAQYTMEYTLGAWAATAKEDAKQIDLTYKADGTWNETSAKLFLVEENGQASIVDALPAYKEGLVVRAANARGGFGRPAYLEGTDPDEGIEPLTANPSPLTVKKVLRNGQLYILYKGTMYNVQGGRIDF